MAIDSEVLVVGGGLAGATAALAAAESGAGVRLVSAKQSTLHSASGLIDVLGYTPGGEGPLADPFGAFSRLPTGHPYERAGEGAVRAGLALFDDVAGGTYAGEHTDRNALVPTHGGTVKPTARYPAGTAAGLASDPRDALFVGFGGLPGLDAGLAAAHLEAAGVPFGTRGVTVEFPVELEADAAVTRYAHLLDRNEDAGGRPVREALADRVRGRLAGEARVGFPAVLGVDDHAAVRADLADRLGADVFEVPMGPPSLPGMRLEERLSDALSTAGVKHATGNPVVDYEACDGAIRTTLVDRGGSRIPYRAEEFVLATGGLVGKGIDSGRERVVEPVFGCRVPHPADRYEWFDRDPFGDHAFARFGVAVDRDLRPLDAGGEPEFRNLRAAGAVLGGYDFAAEKSGAGVSLATGHRAGRLAGDRA